MLVDTLTVMNARTDRAMGVKVRRLEAALLALAIAVLMLGVGVIFNRVGGRNGGTGQTHRVGAAANCAVTSAAGSGRAADWPDREAGSSAAREAPEAPSNHSPVGVSSEIVMLLPT